MTEAAAGERILRLLMRSMLIVEPDELVGDVTKVGVTASC